MQIKVLPGDWGNVQEYYIEVLLADTASYLNGLLRTSCTDVIHVTAAPLSKFYPFAFYRRSAHGPISIQLAARDSKWNQFAYQFSHEFCHVLSGWELLENNPNNWFHETICEVASLFTLRRMAERWPTKPPLSHWASYAKYLESYALKQLSRQEVQLPEGITLQTWLSSHEDELRKDSCQRDKNDLVAYKLLPIFEDDPKGWNAIRKFPDSSGKLSDYLRDWHSAVDSIDKPFVKRLSDALGNII